MVDSVVMGFDPTVAAVIQDRTLVRVFRDTLYPMNLYRSEAEPEQWAQQLGQSSTFTRAAPIKPTTRPLRTGVESKPVTFGYEQWEVTAQQWGASIDTHMLTSLLALAPLYLRNVHQLGLHSAQSLNLVTRDALFNAYIAGNTEVLRDQAASTSLPVVSMNGFTKKLKNGRPADVSPTNPLAITIILAAGGEVSASVVGYTPDVVGDEIHSGVLTLAAAHAGVSARDIVIAANASKVINSGGAQSIDGISAADHLSMADLRAAVSQLRYDNNAPHEDGLFHCHLGPMHESQVFGDNEFQRLNQSIPEYVHYRELALAVIMGVAFYRNNLSPSRSTVDQNAETGWTFAGETVNVPDDGNAVEIQRAIMTAQGAIEEKWIDESGLMSVAGVTGKIGEFQISNNGMQVDCERVRLIMRAPLDRYQQETSSSWTHSGGWAIPTDETAVSGPQTFKRAVVIQSGM